MTEQQKDNVRYINWIELDELNYGVKDAIFQSYKTHRSRKSINRQHGVQEETITWTQLDMPNKEMWVKYLSKEKDINKNDIFKIKLSEIRKWIDINKNNKQKFNIFERAPNTAEFKYMSYPVFKIEFEDET